MPQAYSLLATNAYLHDIERLPTGNRLMLLGVTRACQRLYKTCSAGKPSRFLTDIADGLARVRSCRQGGEATS